MSLVSFIRRLFSAEAHSPHEVDLEKVQDLVGYYFRDPSLLQLALTHRSFVRSLNTHIPSNERLEFLGDSVLGLAIADQLYHDYRRKNEGDLTKLKAMLVNETTLAAIGIDIGLNAHVLLSSEEDRAGGRERPSIISDTVESVIGAVFLDGGFDAARDVVLRLIYVHRDAITADASQRNYKGELLEFMQARGEGMPRYEVIAEEGPDHEKVFRVAVSVNGRQLGLGEGLSKKEAEQKAACEALVHIDIQSET